MCSSSVEPSHAQLLQRECWKRWYAKNRDRARAMKAVAMRRYRAENPEKHRRQSREAKARLKAALLELYGKACARCGFSDPRALTLDHILGNGAKERAELGERGVYRRALSQYRPDEYQTLCMNCQFVLREERWLRLHGLR